MNAQRIIFSFAWVVLFVGRVDAFAANGPTTRENVQIIIATTTEEGQRMLQAVVKADGKPLENAAVRFYVVRTFGNLLVGEDKTLDDGSAAVKFPTGLPGSTDGSLCIIAQVKEPAQYATYSQATLAGGTPNSMEQITFPRALWGRRAPWPLLLAIGVPLGGVWITYAFVVAQIIAIRKGAKS